MIAAGLFLLTAAVLLLPMLPALVEWRWPRDVVPLPIDGQDALDPPFLARSFVEQLAHAMAGGQQRLGRSLIARAPMHGELPLTERERKWLRSRRVWFAPGDLALPAGMSFLGEVAVEGRLCTAANAVYRGLRARGRLELAAHCTILRWAHASVVDVQSGCDLAGRVSAEERINLLGPANFMLLHAPTLCFGTDPAQPEETPPWTGFARARSARGLGAAHGDGPPAGACGGLPAPVVWNEVARRGTCIGALQVASDSQWLGDLVCHGDLALGPRCDAGGSLKVHGDLVASAGCRVAGSLVVGGRIDLGMACVVLGSVVSEDEILLGAGCIIGAPGRPATVSAPRIRVAPGVVVHGTIWALESGRTQSTDAWADEPERLDAAFVERREAVPSDWPEAVVDARLTIWGRW